MNKRLTKIGTLLALAIVTILLLTAASQIYNDIVTKKLTVINATDLRGAVTTGSTLTTGDTTIAGDLAVSGDASAGSLAVDTGATIGTGLTVGQRVTVGSFLRLTPATVITVTTNGAINPAGAYQPLASVGNVQTANIATGTAGNLLTLINESNTTITLTDTGTLKLAGNIALGQFDSLMLLSDGTNWVQIAPVANN